MMCNAILQASGKERLPIVSTAVGGVVKIALNWVLVGTAAINIQGAPVGSICCFAIICIVDYIFLCRALGSRLRLGRMLGAPLLSSLACICTRSTRRRAVLPPAARAGARAAAERISKRKIAEKNILPGKRVIFAKKIRKTGRLPNFLLRYGKKYDRVFGRTKKTLFLR